MNCFYFKKKVFVEGDFSFITDKPERKSLEYDYQFIFEKLKMTNEKYESGKLSVWDTLFAEERYDHLIKTAHPNHDESSFNRNIRYLNYIIDNGWRSFVVNFDKLKVDKLWNTV